MHLLDQVLSRLAFLLRHLSIPGQQDADDSALRLGLGAFFPKIFLQDQPALSAPSSSSPFPPGSWQSSPSASEGCRLLPVQGTSSSMAWPPFFAGSLLPSLFWKENLLQVGVLWPVPFQLSPTLILGNVCLGSVSFPVYVPCGGICPTLRRVPELQRAGLGCCSPVAAGVRPPRSTGGTRPGSGLPLW